MGTGRTMQTAMEQYISIFLVDDDPDDCYLFEEALIKIPLIIQLTIAHDGVELMNKLSKMENLPHALFLDLNMPLKNGFECLAEIKASERLKQINVIILSTSYSDHTAQRLLALGASKFFEKPSDLPDLVKIIQDALNLSNESALMEYPS